MFEFYDDSAVNEFGTVVLSGQAWVYVGKRVGFGKWGRENEF